MNDAPYVLCGVKYIDLVPLAPLPGARNHAGNGSGRGQADLDIGVCRRRVRRPCLPIFPIWLAICFLFRVPYKTQAIILIIICAWLVWGLFSRPCPPIFPIPLPHFRLYEVASLHRCVLRCECRKILEMLPKFTKLCETMGSRTRLLAVEDGADTIAQVG